jgi:hypothetical protein
MTGPTTISQPCPGILQVEMRYIADGQTVENVFHVARNVLDHWTLAEITDVTGVFLTSYWTAHQKASLPATTALTEIVLTDLTDLDGLKITHPISPPDPGTNAAGTLPINVTVALKLSVTNRGRGASGRIFWPTLPTTAVVGDTLTTAYASTMETAVAAIETALLALTPEMFLVVLSRVFGRARRANGIGRRVVEVGVTDLTVDSQKNRLPRHRRKSRRRTP